MSIKYPSFRRDESIIENHFGTVVADPYRWLEDPASEETRKFVEEQTNLTNHFIYSCPQRNDIKSYLIRRHNYPRYFCPYKHGGRYYYLANTGLQNQSIMYVQESLESEGREFLNVNSLSADGNVALGYCSFSPDGNTVAYGLRYRGADWNSIHFRDTRTGKEYFDILPSVKCSPLEWSHDNRGIFYARFCNRYQIGLYDGTETVVNTDQKLYYHKLGTDQKNDVLVAEFPLYPLLIMRAAVSNDGKYLFLFPTRGKEDNTVYYSELGNEIQSKLKFEEIVGRSRSQFTYITNTRTEIYFKTNKRAPNFKIVKINLDKSKPTHFITVVPEHSRDVLIRAIPVYKNMIVTIYIRDVRSVLQLRNIDTFDIIMIFPLDIGSIRQFSGRINEPEIFYKFSSLLTPGIIYKCDLSKSPVTQEVFRECTLNDFNRDLYETDQKFYKSKDGTKIPMFLVYKKDMVRDGKNPCLLHGYGGFNVSLVPMFNEERIAFVECFNGIVAIANIRGGGEYGELWHNAGKLQNKQNVFDDFQAAAEYLVRKRYTNSRKLVIHGSSNGGLLIGACINQAPQLFGAAVSRSGVYDMLRFHKFTTGYGWITDFGNPEKKKDFKVLFEYSPIHNVKVPRENGIQYPATLILTGDHDDRVVPLHSYKFVATLQYVLGSCKRQKNPILLQVTKNAGHSNTMCTAKLIEQTTDIFCFLMNTLKITFKKPSLKSFLCSEITSDIMCHEICIKDRENKAIHNN